MKPVGVENERVMTIFVKSFSGQQQIGKTPLSAINAIFTYFAILEKNKKKMPLKTKDSEVSEYV